MDEWVKRVRRNDEAKILQYTNLSQKEYQKIKKELKVES